MIEGAYPRELVPRPRDEYLKEMFRAIRLGATGRIPMSKVAVLAASIEDEQRRGAPLPTLTAQLHRGTEDLLAQFPLPAVSTAPAPSAAEQASSAPPSPPEPPGQAALAI